MGFNPARAGNIYRIFVITSLHQVQPRPCGEYCIKCSRQGARIGSTPPVRGIFCASPSNLIDDRFNPARAGNINNPYYECLLYKVQPRPCGEYQQFPPNVATTVGSTPPVRGIFGDWNVEEVQHRFNPARAGNIFDCGTLSIPE